MHAINRSLGTDWPELPFAELSATATTLHLWTQVVGKIRLVRTPYSTSAGAALSSDRLFG